MICLSSTKASYHGVSLRRIINESVSLNRLELGDQFGHGLEEVSLEAVVCDLEDGLIRF